MLTQNKVEVTLHDFDKDGNCYADIVLPVSGMNVTGFQVRHGLGGGMIVHMPPWMHTRWSYPEILWSEVRQIIIGEYRKHTAEWSDEKVHGYAAGESEKGESEKRNEKETPEKICTFYAENEKTDGMLIVTIPGTDEKISGVYFSHKKGDLERIQIVIPKEQQKRWDPESLEQLEEKTASELRRQAFKKEGERISGETGEVEVEVASSRDVRICMADLKLPYKKTIIKGFKIKEILGEKQLIISTPKWMERWNDKKTGWNQLCALISEEYYGRQAKEPEDGDTGRIKARPEISEIQPKPHQELQKEKQPEKEKNELGRIKNAENSAFVYYPRTVLRLDAVVENKKIEQKYRLSALVTALNKGSLGGIGPFEISILKWIEKLRYVTSTMLLDLIKAGHVSFGWRSGITQSKLAKIIRRMSEFDLINRTRFLTVNEEGGLETDSDSNVSVLRIFTLGRNGSVLLHELGRNNVRFNSFDIFQDGNTVKRYLTANQWLVYWLKIYKEEVGENYETSCIIRQKGIEYNGARIYATVTLNDCTMVAEPVRRVEEEEIENHRKWLREKIERILSMFDNPDQLYLGKDEISFPQRPILVLICEDDEHIVEVWENVKDLLPEDGRQMVWFTHDLRVFNYDKRGERFLMVGNGEMQRVDLQKFFGKDNELKEGEMKDGEVKDEEETGEETEE